MAGPVRYLTKSRFKLAAECPRKLFHTGKPAYLDRSAEDSFLAALAEGGYPVGELACLMHPGGVRVDDLNHQAALAQKAQLLQRDEVTIPEAALAVGTLFVRVDILRKQGTTIELIEVKAKSYSAAVDGEFRGAKGQTCECAQHMKKALHVWCSDAFAMSGLRAYLRGRRCVAHASAARPVRSKP